MKKLVTIAAVLSLGLALPVYAAEKAAEPAKAGAAAELEGKDGKCVLKGTDTAVTVKDGKVMDGDKDKGAAPKDLPKECQPAAAAAGDKK